MAKFRVIIPNVTITPSPENTGVYLRHFLRRGYAKKVRFSPQDISVEAKCYPVYQPLIGAPEHDFYIEVTELPAGVDFGKRRQKAALVVTDENKDEVIGTMELGKPVEEDEDVKVEE